MQVIELVRQASARLDAAGVCFGHGTTNAFDEAAWLVLWRLGRPLDDLDGAAEQPVSNDDHDAVNALIEERIRSRRPAAYLTREAWLQGVSFYVDERAIVPRSLIAEPLAEGTLDVWLSDQTREVLDLCTGNGSLAVLAALAWPEVAVTAADLSADALEVARINIERHALGERVRCVQGDGLAAVAGRAFDLILCNPPYVNSASMQALPAEYRAEPALALAGGEDGMDFVRPMLQKVAQHLRPGGVLVVEIGHEAPYFNAAFPTLEPLWLPTSAGDDQVLLLTRDDLLTVAWP